MRILMIHAARDSANEYKVHRLLAEHAADSGLEVHLLCQDSPLARSENERLPNALKARVTYADFGRDMHSLPKPSRVQRALLMGRALPEGLRRATQLVRRLQPDAFYASQQSYDIFMGRCLSRLFAKPLLVHLHYTVGPWLGRSTLKRIVRASRVICVSEFIRDQALAAGVPPDRALTLLNAADVTSFDVQRSRRAILEAFCLPSQARIIIAAGRIDPSKGHQALLEAFQLLGVRVPEARLVVCGASTTRDGYEQQVRARADQLRVSDRVTFAGSRPDLPALFAGADVMCLPTENEPFGLVFLEAMAAGLPTVAYRSGGVPEIIQHGKTGFLLEVGDVPGMARRLQELLENPELAERMGAAGKQRATCDFEPRHIAKRWAELVRGALA
jgi:glycosyltransferase involved in cell wall biosynthesis